MRCGKMTKIKICGLTRPEDIAAANAAMPDYIGFMFARRSRRYIAPERAAALRILLADGILSVGVFSDAEEDEIAAVARAGTIDIIQLHGGESREFASRIGERTGLPVIKAVSVTEPDAERSLALWDASDVSCILADSGSGGTGKRFGKMHIKTVKPLFVAGGITPDNVAETIETYSPYAVDVSSGVETNGIKDGGLMLEIVRRVRNA